MTSTIDVVMDRAHPLWDAVQGPGAPTGSALFPCETSHWRAAWNAGHGEWVVLVDRQAAVTTADFTPLTERLQQLTTSDPSKGPIWLLPATTSSAAQRFVSENCPAAVALCWNNPALYSFICVRRSALTTLPAIQDDHCEPLWDWLIRSANTPPNSVSPITFIAGDGPSAVAATSTMSIPSLVSRNPAPEIDWLIQHIKNTKPAQFIPDSPRTSAADSVAIKAGLLLWHDAADASHQLSQSIEGLGKQQAGDYWHAILHRREPDYSNAKYWFRQFHTHPVMFQLPPYVTQALHDVDGGSMWEKRLLGKGTWDPFAFVDLCASCAGKEDSPLGIAARRIQAAEMQLLIVATYQDASGSSS